MAVSFKVPSSPARSIFEIDEFLGVDLTNSGTNVEEHRSPNAENMVRLVPGKVRKRTGYKDNIIFSNMVDVNRILNSSDEWMTFTEFGTSAEDEVMVYKMFEPITPGNVFSVYFELECHGEYRVEMSKNGFWWNIKDAKDYYFGYNRTSTTPIEGLYIYRKSEPSEDDYVRIKNFRVCKKTSATSKEEWNKLEWSPAPEDRGATVIETDSIAPVYGCHTYKYGNFDGNRIVNVNRAKNTSKEFVEYTPSEVWTEINEIYENIPPGRTVYIDFDYEVDSDDCKVLFYFWYGLNRTEETTHFSRVIDGSRIETSWLQGFKISGNGTSKLKIKNLCISYDKDENYKWDVAPEEKGEEFHIEDLYYTEPQYPVLNVENSTNTLLDSTTTLASKTKIFGEKTPFDFFEVSFNIYLNCDKQNEIEKIRIGCGMHDVGNYTFIEKDYTPQLTKVVTYVTMPASTYWEDLVVFADTKLSTGRIWCEVKNITVKPITVVNDYNKSSVYQIYHVGKKLYLTSENGKRYTEIYDNMNNALSSAWQMNDTIYILDGKDFYSYKYGDSKALSISDTNGYIPTITIGKSPKGGGTPYESLNMLQPGFCEMFYVSSAEADTGTFFLSFGELDEREVEMWVMDTDGTWKRWYEDVDFTVNRVSGSIFCRYDSPGESPITGEDNVKIIAYRTVPGYKERITKCTIGTLFGVNGETDRLFVSGNPDYPNWDFYSEQYDPTYFPDTGYSSLGLVSSKIIGYARVNNYLATFKDEYEPSQSVFIREGDLITDEQTKLSSPAFKLINTLQGNGVIAPRSFGYLQTEPLFLTRSGIFAITPQDITGEKYTQNRSFFLNGQLTKEPNLEKAYAVVYNDMYVLALNEKLYILDGLQPIRTDRSEPYATRQYVGFYCTNVPAICLWTEEQALWFGTEDGRVCKFATDIEDLESYNDNGKEIYCCWETPDLDGKLFYKNKSFRYIAIRMMAALKTSAKLYSMARGAWNFIKEDKSSGIFFDFENLDFDAFSFSTDRSDKVAHSKIRVKKVDKARFKIENGNLNEPFGLMNLALEYVESGNYKG